MARISFILFIAAFLGLPDERIHYLTIRLNLVDGTYVDVLLRITFSEIGIPNNDSSVVIELACRKDAKKDASRA